MMVSMNRFWLLRLKDAHGYPIKVKTWSKRSLWSYSMGAWENFEPPLRLSLKLLHVTDSKNQNLLHACMVDSTTAHPYTCFQLGPEVTSKTETRNFAENCHKTGGQGKSTMVYPWTTPQVHGFYSWREHWYKGSSQTTDKVCNWQRTFGSENRSSSHGNSLTAKERTPRLKTSSGFFVAILGQPRKAHQDKWRIHAHTSHVPDRKDGCSVAMWVLIELFCVNRLPQTSQQNGFSPVWTRTWRSTLNTSGEMYGSSPQRPQKYAPTSPSLRRRPDQTPLRRFSIVCQQRTRLNTT